MVVMLTINVHQAKTHLSKYLQDLQNGEEDEIWLCKNNEPLAKLIPIKKKKKTRPVPGLGRGLVVDTSDFEFGDDEIEELFYADIVSEPKKTYHPKTS